jgi:hypothetical protein
MPRFTDHFIIESFWQSESNCAVIALIKAAMIKYGLHNLFKVQQKNDHFIITLHNGRMLILSKQEIKSLNKKNKIRFSHTTDPKKKQHIQQIRGYVHLCFAIIVRSLQLLGYDGKEFTQSAALYELTLNGMKTDHLHDLLGLKRKTRSAHELAQKHLILFKRKKAVLLYSEVHIVVVTEGYYDNYGTAVQIKDTAPLLKGKPAKFWYELR